MKKIRWGIAGPGIIANKFAEAIRNVEGAELVAVASRSAERAKEFASEHNIANSFTSYEEMAASPLVDAVYVSTIHPYHKSVAEVFLNAKKHVLCEKPLCINEYQAKKLKECAKSNGVFLMEAMWTRFLPAVQYAVDLAKNGEIGEILGLDVDFCYRTTKKEENKLFENEVAGGSVLDVGVYTLHLAAMLFGSEPESVTAVANVEDGVDLHTHMLLKYKGGKTASLSSAIAVEKPETAYIYGADGMIILPMFFQADKLIVRKNGENKEILMPYDGNGFEGEIEELLKCVADGKKESDILPLDESIDVIKLMDVIREQIGVKYPFEGEK